ncbi:NAD(P)-dependent oxidoreductase [Methyloceanibacter sp.]|uniref:NAD(P)-dependent oxidoreductase n=1 Tax=Methyloceanibacter sp. TaxID=1965321 RepID=UPI003D6D1361
MKIVVTEPLHLAERVKQALAGLGSVSYGPFDDRALARELLDCDVLMVRLGRHVGGATLLAAPKLRFILTATTGLDHIDLDAARAASVRVISLRDCPGAIGDVSATAEHCFGLLLALLRHTPAAATHVLEGGWDRDRFWGTQLKGKCLGVIGYGRIGAMVARYAASFGMDVIACDQVHAKIAPPAMLVAFDELLRNADVVSVHVTATLENRNLIDRATIARLKRGAILINTARGSLVDEAALAEAVRSGQLLGVAVDVLAGEEHGEVSNSPLLAAAREGCNVLITPHIGGATLESIARTETVLIERFLDVLKGEGAAPAEISARHL